MLTADDIKNLLTAFTTVFATKEDLSKAEERIDIKHNEVLNRMDAVFGEVKAMRIKQAALSQHFEDSNETLRNHDKRIKKLESSSLHG